MIQRTVLTHGCSIAYDIRGSGPPVLFIQGVGAHGDAWLPQTEVLAKRFTCISFDNRGMARSQPVGDELTVDRMAEDGLAILDAEGIDSAHVVGHSMGGLISLRLAQKARDRVRSLTLMCTFASGRAAAPISFRVICLALRSQFGTRRSRRRAFLRFVMPDSVLVSEDIDALAERLARLFGHDLAEQPAIVPSQLRAMRRVDASPGLSELATVPTLVLGGEHDLISPPRVGQALADGIPGATYRNFSEASHGLPVHLTEEVNSLLLEHLTAAEEKRV